MGSILRKTGAATLAALVAIAPAGAADRRNNVLEARLGGERLVLHQPFTTTSYVQNAVQLASNTSIGTALNTALTTTEACNYTVSWTHRDSPVYANNSPVSASVAGSTFVLAFSNYEANIQGASQASDEGTLGLDYVFDNNGFRLNSGSQAVYIANGSWASWASGSQSITVTGSIPSIPAYPTIGSIPVGAIPVGAEVWDATLGKYLGNVSSASGSSVVVAFASGGGYASSGTTDTLMFTYHQNTSVALPLYTSGVFHQHIITGNFCQNSTNKAELLAYIDGKRWIAPLINTSVPFNLGLANPGTASAPGFAINPGTMNVGDTAGTEDVADLMIWSGTDLISHVTAGTIASTDTIAASDLSNFGTCSSGPPPCTSGTWTPKNPATAIAAYGQPVGLWTGPAASFTNNQGTGNPTQVISATVKGGAWATVVDLPYGMPGQPAHTVGIKWAAGQHAGYATGANSATAISAPTYTITTAASAPSNYVPGSVVYDNTGHVNLGPSTSWSGTTLTLANQVSSLAASASLILSPGITTWGNQVAAGDLLVMVNAIAYSAAPTSPSCQPPVSSGSTWYSLVGGSTGYYSTGPMMLCAFYTIANATDATNNPGNNFNIAGGGVTGAGGAGGINGNYYFPVINTGGNLRGETAVLLDYGPASAVDAFNAPLQSNGTTISVNSLSGMTVANDLLVAVYANWGGQKATTCTLGSGSCYACPAGMSRRFDYYMYAQNLEPEILVCDKQLSSAAAVPATGLTVSQQSTQAQAFMFAITPN